MQKPLAPKLNYLPIYNSPLVKVVDRHTESLDRELARGTTARDQARPLSSRPSGRHVFHSAARRLVRAGGRRQGRRGGSAGVERAVLVLVAPARGGHGGGLGAAAVRGADDPDQYGLLRHPACVGDVLRSPRRRPPRRRHARQLLGQRHRLRFRHRAERRPGDAVRAGVRRPAVPHAGPVPAVVAHHVGGGLRAHLRRVVLHGAAAGVPAAGPGGVPRRRGVRPVPDPGALRLLLPAVPAAVPADAVRRGAARGLLGGAVRDPRRAHAPPGERARPRHRRRLRRHLRHLLGLLPHAARLRDAVKGVRRDVEGLLRRCVQVRPADAQARHAVGHHGLLGVLGIRAPGADRRLAAEFHGEHVADRHVLEHGGHWLHDHVRVQCRGEHPRVERDRRRQRGRGEERGGGDDEAVGVPGPVLRPAAGVRPRHLGEALQRERGDLVRVRGHHAAYDGLHRARLRAGRPVRGVQGLRLAAPGRHDQPGGLLRHRHAARHPLRLQAQVLHHGFMVGSDLRADVPGHRAAGDHRAHEMVQDRGRDAGTEGQLRRVI